jgi:hypothetical protein
VFRKDQSLDELARIGNVAQFVSFVPGKGSAEQEFSRVVGHDPNHIFQSNVAALEVLLTRSPECSINLRSFTPDSPRSRHFHYGIKSVHEASALLGTMSADGLFVIANETVDVSDGGVSGVVQSGVMEFAPDDTPRCVEKPGTASLPVTWGLTLLSQVYGFKPEIIDVGNGRLEFSVHPKRRGWKQTHTLMWEYEPSAISPINPSLRWPNRFSRHIGDKTFGLMIAEMVGLRVPKTTVFARRVAPFTFGQDTGSHEVWLRTCPREPEPGRYKTVRGWIDPFNLFQSEDPSGDKIAAILSQSAVSAAYAGAAITDGNGKSVIEGISGEGDQFMLGRRVPQQLPSLVIANVKAIFDQGRELLGAIRFEWVHDGKQVWVVQLHRGATESAGSTVVPGDAREWAVFRASQGLEELRNFLEDLPVGAGIKIEGEVGLTSHIADLLRKSNRPARFTRLVA